MILGQHLRVQGITQGDDPSLSKRVEHARIDAGPVVDRHGSCFLPRPGRSSDRTQASSSLSSRGKAGHAGTVVDKRTYRFPSIVACAGVMTSRHSESGNAPSGRASIDDFRKVSVPRPHPRMGGAHPLGSIRGRPLEGAARLRDCAPSFRHLSYMERPTPRDGTRIKTPNPSSIRELSSPSKTPSFLSVRLYKKRSAG